MNLLLAVVLTIATFAPLASATSHTVQCSEGVAFLAGVGVACSIDQVHVQKYVGCELCMPLTVICVTEGTQGVGYC